MSDWITQFVESSGYWGVLLLMVLENVLTPVPSELIMPLAGYQSARGQMSYLGVVAAGTAGSVMGALPLYWLGRWLGEDRLQRWVERHGHWLALSTGDMRRSREWFHRRGRLAVLICRLVPGVRSLISIPAGVYAMPLGTFLLFTAIGTGIWAALLAYAGVLLGQNYEKVERWVGPVAYVVLGGLLIGFIVRVVVLRRRNHARRR